MAATELQTQEALQRPHIAVFVGTSVDGYIAGPNGSLDFMKIVEVDGEDYGFADFVASRDTALIGRTTYETVRGFPLEVWQKFYAGKRVCILTHRPLIPPSAATHDGPPSEPPDAGGTTDAAVAKGPRGEVPITADSMADLAAQLADLGAKSVFVDGGRVVQQLMAEGLVDELTISIIPVLLGGGTRLFAESHSNSSGGGRNMKLVGSQAWSSTGLVQLHYKFD